VVSGSALDARHGPALRLVAEALPALLRLVDRDDRPTVRPTGRRRGKSGPSGRPPSLGWTTAIDASYCSFVPPGKVVHDPVGHLSLLLNPVACLTPHGTISPGIGKARPPLTGGPGDVLGACALERCPVDPAVGDVGELLQREKRTARASGAGDGRGKPVTTPAATYDARRTSAGASSKSLQASPVCS
jgi:hypothetical protein